MIPESAEMTRKLICIRDIAGDVWHEYEEQGGARTWELFVRTSSVTDEMAIIEEKA